MTDLLLTGPSGLSLWHSKPASVLIAFSFRFVWGPLPPSGELAAYVGARSDEQAPGTHWSDYCGRWQGAGADKHLALVEFCRRCEAVELWFDSSPNEQLQLTWLLDHFRCYPDVASRLRLRLVDQDLFSVPFGAPEKFDKLYVPVVDVTGDELETAGMTWRAYRATTPEACFDLLDGDLSALPLLRPALSELLDELPSRTTGLGATEMRMLELIARGYDRTNALFHLASLRQTRIFNEWEHGYLLDGLAHGPVPAVAGLDDELRTLARENLRDRLPAYHRSRLSLTEFGKAVVAHREDFSRHNPIHRWWGGTELTNDRLWRWGPVLMKPGTP